MSTTPFMILLLVTATIGAAVGGSVAAFSGSDEPAPATTALGTSGTGQQDAEQTQDTGRQGGAARATATPAPDADDAGEDEPQAPTGPGGFGGGGGTIVAGTLEAAGDTTITITTAEGSADVAVSADTPVSYTTTVAEAGDVLVAGVEVTIVSARAEDGSLTVGSVIVGAGGLGGRGGFGDALSTIGGTLVSFDGGVATVATETGNVDIPLGGDVPVQTSTAFADAGDVLTIGGNVAAIAQIGDDGSLTAATVTVGQAIRPGIPGGGGFGGGGGRRGQGGGGFGGAQAQ